MSNERDQSTARDEPDADPRETGADAGTTSAAGAATPGAGGSRGAVSTRGTSGGLVVTAVGQTDIGCQRSVNPDFLGHLL